MSSTGGSSTGGTGGSYTGMSSTGGSSTGGTGGSSTGMSSTGGSSTGGTGGSSTGMSSTGGSSTGGTGGSSTGGSSTGTGTGIGIGNSTKTGTGTEDNGAITISFLTEDCEAMIRNSSSSEVQESLLEITDDLVDRLDVSDLEYLDGVLEGANGRDLTAGEISEINSYLTSITELNEDVAGDFIDALDYFSAGGTVDSYLEECFATDASLQGGDDNGESVDWRNATIIGGSVFAFIAVVAMAVCGYKYRKNKKEEEFDAWMTDNRLARERKEAKKVKDKLYALQAKENDPNIDLDKVRSINFDEDLRSFLEGNPLLKFLDNTRFQIEVKDGYRDRSRKTDIMEEAAIKNIEEGIIGYVDKMLHRIRGEIRKGGAVKLRVAGENIFLLKKELENKNLLDTQIHLEDLDQVSSELSKNIKFFMLLSFKIDLQIFLFPLMEWRS